MNKKYEFLEHTADTKIKAYGETIEEAFENSALATTAVMTDPKQIDEIITKNIKIKAKNLKALLYDFLEEIIVIMDTEGIIIKKTKTKIIKHENKKVEAYELEAELVGDYIKKYELHSIIKAITYSDMEIKKTNNGYEIQIVHDL